MLDKLVEFRELLDSTMIKDIHRRIVLFGYDSYTGRFIKWYAKYYHNIEIDFLIQLNNERGVSHEQEVFTREVLGYNYKDVADAVIWFCVPLDEDYIKYTKNKEYRDFFSLIYGTDYVWEREDIDIYKKRKNGRRDIQFLEFLEWKYGCNFLQVVVTDISSYSCTTQKEIFPILDAVHCNISNEDAIFDFGCGKGGALTAFLDYGFNRVGGVELDRNLYDVCIDNMNKLGEIDKVEIIAGNALDMKEELDNYTWFYFFSPLPTELYPSVINNICESFRRKKRKIRIISINPSYCKDIENTGIFRLRTQITIDTLKRVCDVFETF